MCVSRSFDLVADFVKRSYCELYMERAAASEVWLHLAFKWPCHCSPVINVDLLRNKSDTWDLPFSFLKVNDLLRKIGPQSLGFSDSICAWLYRLSCGLLKDSSSSVLNCLSDVGFGGQNLAVKEDPEGSEPCFNILESVEVRTVGAKWQELLLEVDVSMQMAWKRKLSPQQKRLKLPAVLC